MAPDNMSSPKSRMAAALGAEDPSTRLQAALAAGSYPDPDCLEVIVERCAVESDFYVRDMLTWALIRLPPEITLPRIRRELGSRITQARSQALHTLSKIGDKNTWAWITRDMLRDPDDQVARTAWRTAVALVPDPERKNLAVELASQFGRGDRSVQLSLSRSLIDLGDVIEPVLSEAAGSADRAVAAHARATDLLRKHPETGFDAAVEQARRVMPLAPRQTLTNDSTTGRGEPGESPVGCMC